MPVHLRPSAPTAADAILCGDPSRALAIAQDVLPQPRMSNHHRGLWGYWGETESGGELTVQATGIGGPSAITVLEELAELGVRRAIRVGTCAVAGPEPPPLGSRLLVTAAIAADGCSAALGVTPGAELRPDRELTEALATTTGAPATTVVSRDLQPARYGVTNGRFAVPRRDSPIDTDGGGLPADLQTAATLAFGAAAGIATAAVLAVAGAAGRRLEDEPLDAALMDLARSAAGVLAKT
jgi:purine-nucleoside phosphorylase